MTVDDLSEISRKPRYHIKRYATHRDIILKRNAEYTKRNHARRLEYWKKRNETRPKLPHVPISQLPPEEADRIRTRRRAYAVKNSERMRAQWKQYRKDHPEKSKAHNKSNWHKRRALIANATVNLMAIKRFIHSTIKKAAFACYYCQKRFQTTDLHFDHIVPLSKGGEHSVRNLCTSCSGCNQNKHDKPIEAWVRIGQQVLSL